MSTATIHRVYNDVVAANYDRDPQGVTRRSLDIAVRHLQERDLFGATKEPLRVLDIGMGTGLFLGRLKELAADQIAPFGLDLAEKGLTED